jgi:hypothetical protein
MSGIQTVTVLLRIECYANQPSPACFVACENDKFLSRKFLLQGRFYETTTLFLLQHKSCRSLNTWKLDLCSIQIIRQCPNVKWSDFQVMLFYVLCSVIQYRFLILKIRWPWAVQNVSEIHHLNTRLVRFSDADCISLVLYNFRLNFLMVTIESFYKWTNLKFEGSGT